MTQAARPDPLLVADDAALDFLNSVAAPTGTEFEWLGDGRDLLVWLGRAGLVAPDVLSKFREDAERGRLDAVAAKARDLREWFRAFVRDHAGQTLHPSVVTDLEPVNRVLAQDKMHRQIVASHPSGQDADPADPAEPALRWQRVRRWQSPETLLLPIAEAMGDLISHVDFARIRKCEGATCTMWFHDVSKNHTRRWCTMALCGNRAKAAAHRARRQMARPT